jgi:phosphoglycerate dehydrogenase-like enzyme
MQSSGGIYMRKILLALNITENDLEEVRRICVGWDVVHSKNKEVWPEQLQDAEVIVGWNKAFVEHCLVSGTRLRWVQSWSAGVDKMPLALMAKYGIDLTTTSGIHAYPISESIFAMILSLVRKVHIAIRNQTQKQWVSVGEVGEIHGRTLGIIGVGEIGKETARIGKAFGMTVLGVRSSGQAVEYVDRMYNTSELNELLQASDFVVNTLPLTTQTRHIIGQEQFRHMKPTAYYFNIGRGATTDEAALYEALSNKIIAGAGIDVFEQEPLPLHSPLWELENMIITPHNAGDTEEYNSRAMSVFISNLEDYIRGAKPSINLVDMEREY